MKSVRSSARPARPGTDKPRQGGDKLVAPENKTWDDLFKVLRSVEAPADFMADRSLNVLLPKRGVLITKTAENHR
ncbi:MAG: hypothetical protein FWC42_05300 [Proteobacteria bacterium]|nr:hypothetical protein [Pseudomonadota bacterium]